MGDSIAQHVLPAFFFFLFTNLIYPDFSAYKALMLSCYYYVAYIVKFMYYVAYYC